jgi:alkanesulfonate monooxygenase SsuD/methylene tetrahydromethanopterin reductase-like flavin-dependent oxidoreductase (luciferase family)
MDTIWDDWERAAVESKLRAAIIGSNQTVAAGLEQLIAETGADEIIIVTDTWDHKDRLESYRRVSEMAARVETSQHALVSN